MLGKTRGHIFKRGNIFYLQYDVNGKRTIKSLNCTSQREAEKKRDEIIDPILTMKTQSDLAHITAEAKKLYQPKRKFSINALWPSFEKHLQRKDSSEDSINRYKLRISQFTKWFEEKHSDISCISDISDLLANEYADFLTTTKLASKTHNDTLNALFLVFETFKDEADIVRNPFRKENIPRKALISVSRKEFSEEEAKAILDSFKTIKVIYKEELEVLFYLGMFSGLRLKDAALLQWDKIDFKANRIAVTPEKTKRYGTFVNIPMHPALKAKLLLALSWKENDYVLPQLARRYNESRDSVVRLVSQVLKLNGFESKDLKDKKLIRNRTASIYGFHSLRYSFACFCARAGVPIGLVQEIIGHKSPAMTQFYTRYDNEFRQKAISSLNLTLPASSNTSIKEDCISLLGKINDENLKKAYAFLMDLQNS